MYSNNEPRFSRGEKQTENEMSDEEANNLLGPKAKEFLLSPVTDEVREQGTAVARFYESVNERFEKKTIDEPTAVKSYVVIATFNQVCGDIPNSESTLVAFAHAACWRAQEKNDKTCCDVGVILRACQVWYRAMFYQSITAGQLSILSIAVGYVMITVSCVKVADLNEGTIHVTRPGDHELKMFDAVWETAEKYDLTDMLKPKTTPEQLHKSRTRFMRLMFTNDLPFEL